jgi:hypothetical protein
MKKVGTTCVRVALVGALALSLTPALAEAKGNKVVIKNKTDWEIHHLFLSPTDDEKWGPDQLGDAVIAPGRTFELHSIPCDNYDVKLIDEDGDECVVAEVSICSGQEGWVITNDDLLECEEESGE